LSKAEEIFPVFSRAMDACEKERKNPVSSMHDSSLKHA